VGQATAGGVSTNEVIAETDARAGRVTPRVPLEHGAAGAGATAARSAGIGPLPASGRDASSASLETPMRSRMAARCALRRRFSAPLGYLEPVLPFVAREAALVEAKLSELHLGVHNVIVHVPPPDPTTVTRV
jgi:hypothetical protein